MSSKVMGKVWGMSTKGTKKAAALDAAWTHFKPFESMNAYMECTSVTLNELHDIEKDVTTTEAKNDDVKPCKEGRGMDDAKDD
ncbi:hypothetical protein THRCLA_20406 [Thraustotheca clavata]|uniref:Uncharacterized protein n=1 Tax=Thraustotheca clavata TaxID=74557 RepID=A0A1W0A7N5_9STRA|nr:hypothetical protein THRCLA_20406 [Thraustotheca clavata]